MWNFLKIDRLLTKSFTQSFKERCHHKRKKSQVSNFLSEEAPKEKSVKGMSFYKSFDFLKELSGLQKLHLPGKTIWMDIFNWVWGTFSLRVFFSGLGENTLIKNPAETQSMKIHVKLGEILVGKDVGKIMQNADSPRVTPKSAKWTSYPILKTQS